MASSVRLFAFPRSRSPTRNTIPKGSWAFEVHASHANTFIMSDNVEEYLMQREGRDRLSTEDVGHLLSEVEGDAFYFDGEISAFFLGAHYGVTDRLRIGVHLPAYYYAGGHLDPTIYGFHDLFSLGQGGRNFVLNDQFQVFLKN